MKYTLCSYALNNLFLKFVAVTGAWERVDETAVSDSDSSHEFDDDYDPVAAADSVGQAFGDYKQTKKQKKQRVAEPTDTAFDDGYNPEIDASDPLAQAFGDGYRTAKPGPVSRSLITLRNRTLNYRY